MSSLKLTLNNFNTRFDKVRAFYNISSLAILNVFVLVELIDRTGVFVHTDAYIYGQHILLVHSYDDNTQKEIYIRLSYTDIKYKCVRRRVEFISSIEWDEYNEKDLIETYKSTFQSKQSNQEIVDVK